MTSSPDFPQIQRRLAQLGYYSAPIDDEWGPGIAKGIDTVLGLVEQAHGVTAPTPPAPAAPAPGWPHLPRAYDWIRNVGPVPRHLDVALGLLGVQEMAGAGDSPTIMAWRDAVKATGANVAGYTADSVPWCGLGMAYIMLMADRPIVTDPLWALNWAKFGEDGGQPELGDVLTFKRPSGGHVALYIAEDKAGFMHILGCNQGDSVSIMRIDKARMHSCRQPAYRVKPASVKPYVVAAGGTISRNEA